MDGRGLTEDDITWLTTPTYPGYPYNTANGAGGGVLKVGSGWTTPDYAGLADALVAAGNGDELWVTAGTYYPTTGNDRTVAFVVPNGVSVYGGFDGSEAARAERAPALNVVVLSGDIGTGGDNSDNSYHVLVPGHNSVVDGVTIEAGNADGDWHDSRGAGVLAYFNLSFTLTDCIIQNNSAVEGAGLCAYKNVIPTLQGCEFTGNSADIGGAMLLRDGADASVTSCDVSGNSASDRGGAVYIDYGASPSFSGNTIDANDAGAAGGGVYQDDNASQVGSTESTFNGDTISNNTCGSRGGGAMIYNTKCTATFTSVVFDTNSAGTGGGAAAVDFSAEGTFTGCTFTDNSSTSGNADTDSDGGTVTVN